MTERIKKRILPPTPEVQSQAGDPVDQSAVHGTDDKLFIQLLDDLDNISGGGHRRRRAREIFSEWLFSQDVRNPQIMRLKMEQASGGRRLSGDIDIEPRAKVHQQRSFDVEPFQREQAARRSCGAIGEKPRRPRPSSFHYRREEESVAGFHTGTSAALGTTVKRRPPSARTDKERNWLHLDLKQRIEAFNRNEQGLYMEMSDDGRTFRGSVRIHMMLANPISISAQPPTAYAPDVMESSWPTPADDSSSFHLPKNTTKVIRISNFDTAQEVIEALLAKFNITDNPRKFVLLEKIEIPGKKSSMRQISDDEYPLGICLMWIDVGGIKTLETNKFILQEKSSGESEILWKSFNLLELESFLSVLNREEEEHIDQVKTRYRKFKAEILKHLQLKHKTSLSSSEKRIPVFV